VELPYATGGYRYSAGCVDTPASRDTPRELEGGLLTHKRVWVVRVVQ
jgi:hypothetical protein